MTGIVRADAKTIDDVLERMATIEAANPKDDGVATFNRMYQQVTILVKDAVGDHEFQAGEFLDRLDVNFGNLFFQAYEADQNGTEIPSSWKPLFDARNKPDTHPIQFALAGMNAHISHDLAFAVKGTCQELGSTPEADSPQYADFTKTNDVLEEATPTIKGWFNTGIVAEIDELGGKVDDGFEAFGIHVSRAAAWQTSEMLCHLDDNPRTQRMFIKGLEHTVSLTSRGILL
jgi:hypothetical protein